MEIIVLIIGIIFFSCALIFMNKCNYIDNMLAMQYYADYKEIARAIIASHRTIAIIGVILGLLLGYVVTLRFELWNQ